MTDRLHSCPDSPNGRHNFDIVRLTGPATVSVHPQRCVWCNRRPPPIFAGVGWNTPAVDPDAHLGAVEREAFWQDIGRP